MEKFMNNTKGSNFTLLRNAFMAVVVIVVLIALFYQPIETFRKQSAVANCEYKPDGEKNPADFTDACKCDIDDPDNPDYKGKYFTMKKAVYDGNNALGLKLFETPGMGAYSDSNPFKLSEKDVDAIVAYLDSTGAKGDLALSDDVTIKKTFDIRCSKNSACKSGTEFKKTWLKSSVAQCFTSEKDCVDLRFEECG